MQYSVLLHGIEVHAHLGMTAEERKAGHLLRIDVEAQLEAEGPVTDRLEDTLDYGQLAADVVDSLMACSCQTVERAAREAATKILDRNPHVTAVTLRVVKIDPPTPYPVNQAGVLLTVERENSL